jgi:hypothetical protein
MVWCLALSVACKYQGQSRWPQEKDLLLWCISVYITAVYEQSTVLDSSGLTVSLGQWFSGDISFWPVMQSQAIHCDHIEKN